MQIVLFRQKSVGRNYNNRIQACLWQRLVSRRSKLCIICRRFYWNTHNRKCFRCHWATKNSFLWSFHCNGIVLFAPCSIRCHWSCYYSIFSWTSLLASLWVRSGIHGPPGPGTDESESVRDFQNFVGPGPVRSQNLNSGPWFLKFSWSWSQLVRDF